MESALSVENLSEEEQIKIWQVLQRDELLRQKQNVKVNQVKNELHGLRMKGVLRDGDDLSRLCVRCHCELGIFFNRGEICPSCRFKICKTCRVALLTGGWTCIYCFKQMQLKWLSGEWIHPQVQASSKHLKRRLSGSDIVRSAFCKAESSGNAGKAVTEEIRRAITNGSGPPSSGDLERTSSFESSSIGASTLHDAELERVGFPSESDSFRLSRLIGSYTNRTGNEEREHICIKRASSRPYRDSDSDSSSSTATSPVLSAGRQSLARSTPSLNTAMTLEIGSKKDLRSNPKSPDSRRNHSPGSDFAQGRQINNSSGQSISPSGQTENSQNERQTSMRSGTLSNASSKSRLLDLASYHLSSSKKNLSVSTDSGQVPLSQQTDTGSEMEFFEQSQSSGSRTKLSSDTSDNETPIDSYFMGHFSKEENKQTKLTGEDRKMGSQKRNEDALMDVSQSRTYSGGGGGGGGVGGGRDDISDSSSQHTTPEHWLNGNRRKAELDASLPSITISEAEGSVSAQVEGEEENKDLLKGSQSFRSGQSTMSSMGFTSSLGSRDSLSSYYSNAGEVNYGKIVVTGEIQFGLDYDYKTVCLEIRIKQCRDLAAADGKKIRSDPYVKSYLLPDKSKTGKRKTKVKKNCLNPVFDEILRYSIAKSELENRTLWLTVWHNDRFGRNDFLGEVTIPFDYYRFEGPALKWYPLQQRQEFTPSSLAYKGELSISLKFQTVADSFTGSTMSLKHSRGVGRSSDAGTGGQLHVYIKEARNLTAVRSGGYSDPFCKGYLLPEKNRSSKQKTPVVKKNCNPVWNHLFVFEDVSANELSDRCLELTLWDYDRLSSNDFLGGIRLNLGSGICGRKYVDWMDASGSEISLWQSMISCPNTWVDGTLILRANMNNRK